MLSLRFGKVIGKFVGPNQHAFVPDCQILDASLIANECINLCLKSNRFGVLFMLDIGKAFDHVL